MSCSEVAEAISEELHIPRHRFFVHKFHPEDFLVVFAAPEFRKKTLEAGSVEHGSSKLFVRPWLRQAQVVSKVMRSQVDLIDRRCSISCLDSGDGGGVSWIYMFGGEFGTYEQGRSLVVQVASLVRQPRCCAGGHTTLGARAGGGG